MTPHPVFQINGNFTILVRMTFICTCANCNRELAYSVRGQKLIEYIVLHVSVEYWCPHCTFLIAFLNSSQVQGKNKSLYEITKWGLARARQATVIIQSPPHKGHSDKRELRFYGDRSLGTNLYACYFYLLNRTAPTLAKGSK